MYGIVMAESMIINEVIPVVDCRFRTIANRGGRAITGFSGGGAGCLRLAFKYPQLFCATRSCAGAIDDRGFNVLTEEPQLALAMFNNDTDAFELQTSFGQSAANRDAIIVAGLAIQMSIGNQDNLLAVNRQLDSHLTSLGIPHDPLIELPGLGHDLEGFWRVSGAQPLDFLYSHFSQ
jgi:enterochelin esterase-like enzyme